MKKRRMFRRKSTRFKSIYISIIGFFRSLNKPICKRHMLSDVGTKQAEQKTNYECKIQPDKIQRYANVMLKS